MKTNILSFILLIATCFVAQNLSAYDFSAKNSDGVLIYYNIINESNKTCEVTAMVERTSWGTNDYFTDYVGVVNIPATVIGYQVTRIGSYAFRCCKDLTSVTIPNSVTSIRYSAFYNCKGLTSVKIPNSVTTIGNSAFYGCSGLTSVTIPNSVTSIEGWAFSGCTRLTSIMIPNSVASIGDGAFYDCSGLTSVTIPNSVTSIGFVAFYNCKGLSSVTIPNSVTYIGFDAFSNCTGLTSITSYITNVFETEESNFYGCENATLYVPAGLVSTYQSTAEWNRITQIEEIPGISLAMACSNQGKVMVNDYIEFTNKLGEVTVYEGADSKFVFTPDEGCQLERVIINGLDVTNNVKNNQLTTTIYPNYSMMVFFNKMGADVNRDGQIDISDVVALVNIILGQ